MPPFQSLSANHTITEERIDFAEDFAGTTQEHREKCWAEKSAVKTNKSQGMERSS